jgi:hypothetical protein
MNFAGYKTVNANTMPSETTVDLLRDVAYNIIRRIIGSVSDTATYDAKSAEMQLVAQGIAAIKAGQVPQIILTPEIEDFLSSKFSVLSTFDHFEPGQDETN